MPELKIPKPHLRGLRTLARLPAESVEALVSHLSEEPQFGSPIDGGEISGLRAPDYEALVKTIDSLYRVRAYYETPTEEFATSVINAYKRQTRFESSEGERTDEELFKRKLESVLRIRRLSLRAKANVLGREYEHIYHKGRILTDLRPVFSTDATENPAGLIVSHQLKLVYHQGFEHKEIVLTLDTSDMLELKRSIERAEEKELSIRKLMKEKNILII